MKLFTLLLLSSVLGGCVATSAEPQPSIPEMIAGATVIPSPWSLPSMTSDEWCKTVDAALSNPHISSDRKDEYIRTGQAQHCPHQMFLEPPKAAGTVLTANDFCAEAFKALANPYVDQSLKAAVLEKARNRGCLR